MRQPADRMVLKEGWSQRRIMGLALLVVGLLIWQCAPASEGGTRAALAAPAALSIGALLLLYRKDVVLDRRARTLTARWGLIVPLGGRQFPFNEAEVVSITRESRSAGEHGDVIVYPVRIECPGGPVTVAEPMKYQAARRKAEEIARFIGLGVRDSTADREVVREAGTLDQSLRERLHQERVRPAVPAVPRGLRSRVAASGAEATIELAPKGFGVSNVLAIVFGLGIAVGLAFGAAAALARGGPYDAAWFAEAALVLGVPMLAVAAWIVWRAVASGLRREWVVVNPYLITHRYGSPLGMTTRRMPVAELEDLSIGQPETRTSYWMRDLILARSDKLTLEIGLGLDRRELEWVAAAIRSILAAQASSGSPGGPDRPGASGAPLVP